MRNNPVQFAVVREDPQLEQVLVDHFAIDSALLIASGGCTALSLRASRPDCALTLLDMNEHQLNLVQRKLDALALPEAERNPMFNVETIAPDGLSECGNFESLFRQLRGMIQDFVVDPEELQRAFRDPGVLSGVIDDWFSNPYWSVAFDLTFHSRFLNTMFGPAATQHATPDSYPGYFRQVIEGGLRRADAFDNHFLHHIFLGHYIDRPEALPSFLVGDIELDPFETMCGELSGVPRLSDYGLISLSNVMDWMAPDEQADVAKTLSGAREGAVLILRQLNNQRDLGRVLGDGWKPDDACAKKLLEMDRSLFYERIGVYVRA